MQQELKPLPISSSDITTILTNNFLYIDKTKFVYDMIKVPSKYFLSRPRRFGKSTLLSTLNEVFLGKKELFKDQWIYNSPWDWQEYPIIRLDFNVAMSTNLEFYIKNALKRIAKTYAVFNEIDFTAQPYDIYFENLIIALEEKYNKQVVILIDEYDKPILDVIDNIEEAKAKRDILKGFYGVIKGVDAQVRFVFLTGVTRFSKVGVFSGLNNLNDITLNSKFATVCGITQEELELYCKDYIELLANKEQITYNECLTKIKYWYNGFCFSEDGNTVYSPFSTFLLFENQKFANYWFSSGNPSFLIKLLMKNQYYLPDLHGTSVDPIFFDSFDIDKINLKVLLLQAGYLTISKTQVIKSLQDSQRNIGLAPPNYEISLSLNAYIIQYIYGSDSVALRINQMFIESITSDNINSLANIITSLFASIPYYWYTNNAIQEYEGFYCSVFYAFLVGSGYNVIAEDTTNHGRIDLTLILQNRVYIFELKTTNKNKSKFSYAENNNTALEQIIYKNYAEKYQGKYDKIYLIGAEFSETDRNISDFAYKIIE